LESNLENKIVKKMNFVVKKMKIKMNKEDGDNNDRKMLKRFWKSFLKQSKDKKKNYEIKLMPTN